MACSCEFVVPILLSVVSSCSIVVLFEFDAMNEKFSPVDVSEATDADDDTCWLFSDFENISVENELWGLVFTGGLVVAVDGIMTGEPDVNFFDSVSLEGNEDTPFVVLYVALLNGVDEVEIESFLSVDVGFDFGVAFDLTELLFPASMVFVIKTPEISVLFFSLLDISFWRWCSLIKLAVPVLEALIWVLV